MLRFFSIILLITLVTFMFGISAGSQQNDIAISKTQITESKTEQNNSPFTLCLKKEDTEEIKEIVRGATENTDWMQTKDKEELHKIMNRYFTGELLEELTEQTWQFINMHTDWYGTANVEKITFNSIDENMVRVLAYIKESDVVSKTSNTITGEFVLVKTDNGWRIEHMTIKE